MNILKAWLVPSLSAVLAHRFLPTIQLAHVHARDLIGTLRSQLPSGTSRESAG
jgi:hypothetical protein